jgi:hypothetical protein
MIRDDRQFREGTGCVNKSPMSPDAYTLHLQATTRYMKETQLVVRCLDMVNSRLAGRNGVLNGPNDTRIWYPFGCMYCTIIASFLMICPDHGIVRHIYSVNSMAPSNGRRTLEDHLAS